MTEAEIVSACLRGDSKYEWALYEKYAPRMYAVCLRYANRKEEAQDFLQEGFIKVFENLKSYRGDGSLEGWIRRIIVNVILKSFRKKAYKMEVRETYLEPTATTTDALSKLSEKELCQMINELPEGYKIVFNLYVIEGFSHKEIATELKINESTSRSQLAKARNMLQQKISSTENYVIK